MLILAADFSRDWSWQDVVLTASVALGLFASLAIVAGVAWLGAVIWCRLRHGPRKKWRPGRWKG